MRRYPLFWHIFPSYLLVILAVLLSILGYTTRSVQTFYKERIADDLLVRARLVCEEMRPAFEAGDLERIQVLCRSLGAGTSTRITAILPDGRVAGDSEESPEEMENHLNRPEIQEVISGGEGSSVRFSGTLGKNLMYEAVSLDSGGRRLGFVRVAVPLTRIEDALWAIDLRILYGGAVVAVLAAILSLFVSRRFSRPLEQMRRGAERFAKGDFSARLDLPQTQELSGLADAMNQMARELDNRIRTVNNERNQQEAVLASMVEGVLAVDTGERIISFNRAAARLLNVDLIEAQGRTLSEIAQDTPLRQFVGQVLRSNETREGEFVTHDQDARMLQAHGSVLRDAAGKNIGAVVVLNDVTRLRRLEQVRRDFVANVSHELRTPITSIKGFVETLLDGALENAEDARRFLSIVAKQADRLNAILNDLMLLSRVEEGQEKSGLKLELAAVHDALEAAVLLCESKAAQKGVCLELRCDKTLRVRMNPSLIEQAVANLVDNAIKYSESGGPVTVSASRTNGEVIIEVKDKGCGIPEEHLSRLFERFYRVDKARSRSLGGTGLGLAIVKHIAKAHEGHVAVRSAPGSGATFSIHLPGT